ncbi:MAG: hypothetical protein AAGI17_02225 [Planctomycetota bacterium]
MFGSVQRRTAATAIGLAWLVTSGAAAQQQYLLVTDAAADTVRKYSLDGDYLGDVFAAGAGGLDAPLGMAIAPDGSLLVSGDLSGQVHRYDLDTGASLDVFAEGNGLVGPAGLTFQGGNLWVSDGRTGSVFRFDATSGAFVDRFLSDMVVPEAVVFGNDTVYVGDWLVSEFRAYDLDTGTFEGQIVRGNGLERPLHAEISADGSSIMAVNFFGNTLTEHDIATGDLIRSIDLTAGGAPMSGPVDWITLADGSHIVSSTLNGSLLKYDEDWDYVGVFAQGDAIRAGAILLVPSPATGAAFLPVLALTRRRRPRNSGRDS